MVPPSRAGSNPVHAAPRTRGDGPRPVSACVSTTVCSPHPRGWSHARRPGDLPVGLLPAPAGMVPAPRPRRARVSAAPRTRGDGPISSIEDYALALCSPHPRGWSPHPPPQPFGLLLLPAPAGMVPRAAARAEARRPAPRTRGDGPANQATWTGGLLCSPHPRGWSPGDGHSGDDAELLPAPAGMVPSAWAASPSASPAPRTRGDGPVAVETTSRPVFCSPHPRGWSLGDRARLGQGPLLPAPAGMVPPA